MPEFYRQRGVVGRIRGREKNRKKVHAHFRSGLAGWHVRPCLFPLEYSVMDYTQEAKKFMDAYFPGETLKQAVLESEEIDTTDYGVPAMSWNIRRISDYSEAENIIAGYSDKADPESAHILAERLFTAFVLYAANRPARGEIFDWDVFWDRAADIVEDFANESVKA